MNLKRKGKVEQKCYSTHNILVLTGVIWKCLDNSMLMTGLFVLLWRLTYETCSFCRLRMVIIHSLSSDQATEEDVMPSALS